MADYLHGAYGEEGAAGSKTAAKSRSAIVYIGTAPVHTVPGGGSVNRPVMVSDISEARALFGYSEEWEKYTLCEAMHAHLEMKGVGPLVLINVFDPKKHKKETGGTLQATPVNGRISIPAAGGIIMDSVKVGGKTAGTDYVVSYNIDRSTMTIAEKTGGALGTEEVTVTWDIADPKAVTEADVIGATDRMGLNTGIYAVRNVYQMTGCIPSVMAVPGFSEIPAVKDAMNVNSKKVNGHWNVYMLADLPLESGGKAVTMATAAEWKAANGYNLPGMTVSFPMVSGTDGRKYHLSVLRAANFQQLTAEQEGVPYRTASNTECAVIESLYFGGENDGRVYDDEIINEYLNRNGIASAAYVGGRWCLWGAHGADYTPETADRINVSETNRMMMYYLVNDFQHRRPRNADKPMTVNDIRTIVAEEQARLDALVKIGALTYGEVHLNAQGSARHDIMNGDFLFEFNVTTTPLAKSLTAQVNWVDDGWDIYFAEFSAA